MILRATWDYIDRLDEFLTWTARVRNLLNAPSVVAWNTDKRYLADLADAGVPDGAEPVLRRPASQVHTAAWRGGGEARCRRWIGWGTTVYRRPIERACARRWRCTADGQTVLCAALRPAD